MAQHFYFSRVTAFLKTIVSRPKQFSNKKLNFQTNKEILKDPKMHFKVYLWSLDSLKLEIRSTTKPTMNLILKPRGLKNRFKILSKNST